MTEPALPRSRPGAQGVDARGIAAFLDAVEADPRIEMHSLMVLRHGSVVAEGWWAPYGPDRVHLLYSLSKTFTATALGFAVAEGLAGLDDRVVDHFPEFADEIDGRSRDILVRHVAAMASGHDAEMIERAVSTDPSEPVRGFLLHEPEHEPGSWFAYNQPCTYSVAAIVQRAAKGTLVDFLRPRLFDPLGIGPVAWSEEPAGRSIGFSGLHARTEDIAKLGQVYLEDGRWRGEPLLPDGWAAQVRTKHVDNPREPNPDWRQGYGFQVWLARHGYRGDGAYGQYALILPDQDAVVAITSATFEMQAQLDYVWEHLLPALDAGAATDADEIALVERLQRARIGSVVGAPIAAEAAGDYAVTPAPSPEFEAAADRPVPHLVRSVRLDGDEPTLTLGADGGSLRAAVGAGHWAVTADPAQPPVAVSGGTRADGTLQIEVIFLETPHRVVLELDPATRAGSERWATVPLGITSESLLTLRAPW